MELGVYVHVPFCATRCDYCDFATWADRGYLVDAYVDACVTDLRRRAASALYPPATSVFIGGGTPSLLPADHLVRLVGAVEPTTGAEVTVECNPDHIDAASLAAYRNAGVTRLSFGVQSMRPHVLAALGRTHGPDEARVAFNQARAAGFENLSLDLIYGAPGETLDDWRRTLDEALDLDAPHVSAYALTVEPGTPLARRVEAGTVRAPDDDEQADKYAIADEALGAAGLEWYEISNWARPGRECRHNLLYWSQGEYLGIGCAAHGHTGGRRWWNVRSPERYIEQIRAEASPEAGAEVLDAGGRAEEAFVLALRTRRGARPAPSAAAELADLSAARLLERRDSRVVLTRRGRLLANEVTTRLLLAGAAGAADPGVAERAGTR